MRCLSVVLMLLLGALAGCADDPDEASATTNEAFADLGLDEGALETVILGVVVNEAIEPVAGATVRIVGAGMEQTSDEQGRFLFADAPDGWQRVQAEKPNHISSEVEVEVVPGALDPPVIKITLERVFDQSPYTDHFSERGLLECGIRTILIQNSCISDYTRYITSINEPASINGVGPCTGEGCVAALDDIQNDHNRFLSGVDAGWQSQIWEVLWDKSAMTTNEHMTLTISHEDRTRIHYFARDYQTSPMRLELKVNQKFEVSRADRTAGDMIPEEGLATQMFILDAGDVGVPPFGLAFQQDFEVFHTEFYYGLPPDGWSLVAGDDFPF